MQWKVSMIVLTGLSALFVTGCSTSRMATSKSVESKVESSAFRDSVKVESVAVCDSVMEVTTVTIRENEQGDTLRMTTVTDRTRIRERERVRDVEVKFVEKHDTVFVQKTDSVYVQNTNLANDTNKRVSPLSYLKWVFWIIVAVTVLIVIIKVVKVFRV